MEHAHAVAVGFQPRLWPAVAQVAEGAGALWMPKATTALTSPTSARDEDAGADA